MYLECVPRADVELWPTSTSSRISAISAKQAVQRVCPAALRDLSLAAVY
jgi:hypothetical protein